jgi:GPH family glycoside/pentoside/hexuronide:cation symporter
MLASVMPDICDLDELEHGERREGLFTAVLSFMTKLESSLCTGLGGALLVISGFDAHLLQQPQVVLDKMRLYAFSPMIIGTILTFVAACFFPLGKKKMDEIRAQLDARHAAIHIPGVKVK